MFENLDKLEQKLLHPGELIMNHSELNDLVEKHRKEKHPDEGRVRVICTFMADITSPILRSWHMQTLAMSIREFRDKLTSTVRNYGIGIPDWSGTCVEALVWSLSSRPM